LVGKTSLISLLVTMQHMLIIGFWFNEESFKKEVVEKRKKHLQGNGPH
jgi:hypothetical protein